MKAVLLSFILWLSFNAGTDAFAQMSRQEAKHWYKIYQKTSPLAYKALVEGNDSLRRVKAIKEGEVRSLRARLQEQDLKITRLRDENRQLEEEVREINASRPLPSVRQGVYMRVRFHSDEKVNLSEKLLQSTDLHIYHYEGGTFYLIGYFKDYWLAENFRRHLLKVGIPEAEIMAFCNGIPMDMKDALAIILGGEVEDCRRR